MKGDARISWKPLAIVAMAQVLLVFNISTLQISIDAIVDTFGTTANTVKSAIIVYSLVVAACILVGAKLAAMYGAHRVFRATIAVFACAMLAMMLSADASAMVVAQMTAGAAAAILSPTSIALVAEHYPGEQQARVIGWLSGVRSLSLICAFLIAGAFATWSDWRLTYALLVVLAAVTLALSRRLDARPVSGGSALAIDKVGFAILIGALTLIGLGFENLTDWGVVRARPAAPFDILTFSPALLAIAGGILLVKAFLTWARRQHAAGRLPLISPKLLGAPSERAVLFSMFTIGTVGSAVTFLIPLYIEIVQGRNSIYTALALIPYTAASFIATVIVGRLRTRIPDRYIARAAFLSVAAGFALLGAVVRNDWSDILVISGLAVAGAGEGALVTLLFKMLASTTPSEAAADVDPLCSATSHLAVGVGTATAGALIVGLLSSNVHRDLTLNPAFAETLRGHLNLDQVAFVSNDRLRYVLERTNASPEHIDEAVRIYTEARLRALRASFLALSLLALLAAIPYSRRRNTSARTRSNGEPDGERFAREHSLSG